VTYNVRGGVKGVGEEHMQYRAIYVACLVLGMSVFAYAQTADSSALGLGNPAPEIGIEKLLQAPTGAKADLASLRGKVIVLEFWATWCAPCVAAMPHLNDLADKFRDQAVQFIAITDEEQAVVERFVRRREIRGWIGLDTNRATFKAYSVNPIPHTVVVDQRGRLAAITEPNGLTEDVLQHCLAADGVTPPGPSAHQAHKTDADSIRFELTIRRTDAPPSGLRRGDGTFHAESIGLQYLLSVVYGIRYGRVVIPETLRQDLYAVSARAPQADKGQLESILKQAIELSLGLKIHKEARDMEAFVLTLPQGRSATLTASTAPIGSSSQDKGVLTAKAAPFGALLPRSLYR
jgi:thiol-disulfide isomerase/thioredoxin